MRIQIVERKNNKVRFYNLINKVEHKADGLVHTLCAIYSNGTKVTLTYTEGGTAGSVHMSTTNRSGVTKAEGFFA